MSEARSSPTRKSQTADRCAALPPDGVLLAGVSLLAETAAALDNAEHASALHALLEPVRGEISEFGVGGLIHRATPTLPIRHRTHPTPVLHSPESASR